MKIVRLHTEQDYFDALEILYNEMDYDPQCLLLFKVLIKMCNKFEHRKRQEKWQHLQWSN